MRLLHIANTGFEFELIEDQIVPLEKALRRNPIVQQLQFLPLLYAEKVENICVADRPSNGIPCRLLSDSDFPYDQVESWGASRSVAQWAQAKNLDYEIPPWDVVREVNSKAFSFVQTAPLPQAELVSSWEELEKWMKHVEGPKVLKTCFGLSGQGHLLVPAPLDKVRSFALREFQASRPLIAEPWVERILDFSTQWIITWDKAVVYVGATVLKSDAQGRYSGTIVGTEEKIFGDYFSQLQKHKDVVHEVLKKIAGLGFFGNVGIDSMIWGSNILHPIVEINARKTMGWVALQIAKRLFPNQTIQVSYGAARSLESLLPQGIIKPTGEVVTFHRNLYVEILA